MTDPLDFKTKMTFAYGVPSPMSPGVVRVVAENPSPLTFRGTNTYLVGATSLAVIDPGPDDEAHRRAVLAAANGRPITHVLVTHAHRDHIDGAAALAEACGARTYAFGRDKASVRDDQHAAASSPSGRDFINLDFVPDVAVRHGMRIEGEDFSLECLHTPGHAPDHICFALANSGIVFTGDHVMAWNTTVIAPPEGSMADYMASLQMLLVSADRLFLPGHGGRLGEPQRTVKAYLIHRQWREREVMAQISAGLTSIDDIVPVVYPGLDPRLAKAARMSVMAHVEHLIERNLAACSGSLSGRHALRQL